MRSVIFVMLFAACASDPPKTYASMLWHRLHDPGGCRRSCPVGETISQIDQGHDFDADCCKDPAGVSWTSCAWNADGKRMTLQQLVDPVRIASFTDCGGGSSQIHDPLLFKITGSAYQ